MQSDEDQIRELQRVWMLATKEGDVNRVLALMTDDVVFLVTGRPPMYKTEFSALARSQAGSGGPKIDGQSEIQEIQVMGEWAFMWTKLDIAIIPPGGTATVARSGYSMTLLRKEQGKWLLARDANMLATQSTA